MYITLFSQVVDSKSKCVKIVVFLMQKRFVEFYMTLSLVEKQCIWNCYLNKGVRGVRVSSIVFEYLDKTYLTWFTTSYLKTIYFVTYFQFFVNPKWSFYTRLNLPVAADSNATVLIVRVSAIVLFSANREIWRKKKQGKRHTNRIFRPSNVRRTKNFEFRKFVSLKLLKYSFWFFLKIDFFQKKYEFWQLVFHWKFKL